MRLLVVGADSNYAIENSYVKYFAETKEITKVDFFKAQNRFLAYYNKSTFNKVSYRLGFSSVLKDINKELIENAIFFYLGNPSSGVARQEPLRFAAIFCVSQI